MEPEVILDIETAIDRETDFAKEIAAQNALKDLLAAEEAAHKRTRVDSQSNNFQDIKNYYIYL